MQIDLFTLVLLSMLVNLFMGFGMILIPSAHASGLKGTRAWGIALLTQSAGWLISGALRGVVPDPVSSSLGNGLLLLSLVIYLKVIVEFKGERLNLTPYYALVAAAAFALAVLMATVPEQADLRILIVSSCVFVIMLRPVPLLLRRRDDRTLSDLFAGVLFLWCSLGMLSRGLFYLASMSGFIAEVPVDHPANILAYLALNLTGVLLTFGYLLMCHDRDIKERLATEKQIRHYAQHDSLTGLPNRALCSDRLAQALANAQRDNNRLALMFLDINRFKPVNDSCGHAVGDVYLQIFAQRLRSHVRAQDTVARIGGDEFVILLPRITHPQDAEAVARKILVGLAEPAIIEDLRLPYKVSIGIACFPDHGTDEAGLFGAADIAMYDAKASGDNQIRFASPQKTRPAAQPA